MIGEVSEYELHHRARLAIKPGITGMWQVSGRSDITDFEEVVELDKEYIENWNIGLDIVDLKTTTADELQAFFAKPFRNYSDEVREYYSIEAWVDRFTE